VASSSPVPQSQVASIVRALPIRERIECVVDELFELLPNPIALSSEQQRGIIARYAAVLEGNFIYWMTATLLSVKSDDARSIIEENLLEEVRDCHPGMMRRFALAAHAAPTESDSMAVYWDLTKVRLFLGRLSPVQNLVTMAFFEGFIQRFMAYLADLSRRQGSTDMEYTDVHGVCDITHTEELYRALDAEMALAPPAPEMDIFEGVALLRTLLRTIVLSDVEPVREAAMAHAN
jgi:hypothetical protein